MKVVLLGVRGSRCAPGVDFAGVGGHTSCVAIAPKNESLPSLILDAGTGLSSIRVPDRSFSGEILLTHLHWDHVQGIPFFQAGDSDDAIVRVRMPAQGSAQPDRRGSATALLAESMSPPHFPIGPDGLRGSWHFDAIDPGTFDVGGFRVTCLEVPHKGGRTFGYRVEEDGVTVAYVPDHCPRESASATIELGRAADVLLLGGMFADSEIAMAHDYGHATIGEARSIAAETGAAETVIVHHAPTRTDQQVEQLIIGAPGAGPSLKIGREGDVVLGFVGNAGHLRS